jgi:hypothetical protein
MMTKKPKTKRPTSGVSPLTGQTYFQVQYGFGKDGDENPLQIGIFCSRKAAKEAIENLKKKPGFRRGLGRWWLTRGLIDDYFWREGFTSISASLKSPTKKR